MASLLLGPLGQFGKAFTPPQFNATAYDGPEYVVWKWIVFRPGLFHIEIYLLAAVITYLAFFWFGSGANSKKASAWLNAHKALYDSQFSRPLDGGLTKDGYSDMFAFSTGRRALRSLHTVFTLRPRHDLLQLLFQFGWANVYDLSYEPRDTLTLEFALAEDYAAPDAVFAIVAKDEMGTIRKERWDLSFTKTSENPALPAHLTVMSEFADVTDSLFKAGVPLLAALKDPQAKRYFRSLIISDQPLVQPDEAPVTRSRSLVLTLTPPPPSEADATVSLVTAVFALIDTLDKLGLRPETKIKLRKAREDFTAKLREARDREAKEEAADARAAAKKKAEDERIAGLSATEQAKILERERKRNLRKGQGKMVRK
ncbi:DUF1682-domain-containing protein [Peniophora sp. CONT]|nr:DUF1682-domain-containing protein [Peniophora sp. CONT]